MRRHRGVAVGGQVRGVGVHDTMLLLHQQLHDEKSREGCG